MKKALSALNRRRNLTRIVLIAVIFIVYSLVVAEPSREVHYIYNEHDQSILTPIKVQFSQDVQDDFEYAIKPFTPGRWRKDKDLIGVSAITFEPASKLEAGRTYSVVISDVKRLSGELMPNQTLLISTKKPPVVQSFEPEANGTIKTNAMFKLTLGANNEGLRRLSIGSSPTIEFEPVQVKDGQIYTWKPKTVLPQGTKYELWVDDLNIADPQKRRLVSRSYETPSEPKVVNASSGGGVYPNATLSIKFDQAMVPDAVRFAFGIKGAGLWMDPQTYNYTISEYQAGKTYSYTILKGARSVLDGVTESDLSYQVSTPGAVTASISPSGYNVGLGSAIRVDFDQPVDHATAQSKFSLSPNPGGSFVWNGNTMSFVPKGLDYQTDYVVSEAAGVGSVYGLPSIRSFSSSFSTVAQTIRMPVPVYHQQFALSCEASSLRMVLAFLGITSDDMTITTRMGYAPRNRDNPTNSWDSPYQMFVGNINGTQNSTGYGAYAGPVAAAALSFGRPAAAYSNISASFISARIHEGHPVIVWGNSSSSPYLDSWNTSGGVVQAWKGEHTRVVIGVVGSVDAPIGFYVNDPATGYQGYWSAASLMGNINIFGSLSNQAVVVY